MCSWLENATFNPPYLNDQTVVITNNPLFPCSDKATLLSWCDTVTAVQSPLPTDAELAKGGELQVQTKEQVWAATVLIAKAP